MEGLAVLSDQVAGLIITWTSNIAGLCWMASQISGDLYHRRKAVGWGSSALFTMSHLPL